jgi:uncharacterized repeat protein (TIGR01451 family)
MGYAWLLAPLALAIGSEVRAAEVNKVFAPDQISPGGVSRMIITIYNSDPITLTNTAITDNLPAGMRVASSPNAQTTCGGGTVTAVSGATSFALSGGTVPAGTGVADGTCTIEVDVTTTTPGNSINTLPAGALTNSQNQSNADPASATLQVRTLTAPGVTKRFAPNTIFTGNTATLTLEIRNNDLNLPLTNAAITDALPTNLTIAGAATTTCTGGSVATTATSVSLTGASVPPNSTCQVAVPVSSTVPGSYMNEIPTGALTTQEGGTNASPTSAPIAVQTLAVSKSFAPTAVATNEPSRLTITVQNGANSDATGVSITDNLPAQLRIAPTPNPSTTCGGSITATAGGGTIGLTGGTVPAAVGNTPGSCTIAVDVIGTTPGNFTNQINIGQAIDSTGGQNFAAASAPLRITNFPGGFINLSKSFSPPLILAGTASRLDIRIRSDTSLLGMSVTDNLPATVVVANSAAASTTCPGGSVTATPGSGSVTLTGASLTGGQECHVYVNVTSNTQGRYTNTIPGGTIVATDTATGNPRTNDTAATAGLDVMSGVELSKAFSPNAIAASGRTTLTVTVRNFLSAPPMTNTQVTDNLPANVVIANPPNALTTCVNGTVTATPGGNVFRLNGATIPPAQGNVPGICTFQVDVTSSLANGTRDNVIPANSVTTSIAGVTNLFEATARLTIGPLNVPVNKDFNPRTVSGGSTSVLTVTLTNPTNNDYLNASFTDNMPSGMQVASVPNATTTCAGGSISANPGETRFAFSGGLIPRNGSCTVSLRVVSLRTGNLTNTLPIGTISTSQAATNSSAASATLTNLPSLGIAKRFIPNTIPPGGTATLELRVLNARRSPITNVRFTDNLPAGVTVATTPNLVNTCRGSVNATGNTIALTGGTLNAAASCIVQVDVTAVAGGPYTNTIPANSVLTAEGVTNKDPATDVLTVATVPTLRKSFNPTSIPLNGVSTLTLELGNPSASTMTLTRALLDNLPTGVTVANPAAIGGTCSSADVTAAVGAATITYANGASIPIGGCTIAVNVTSGTSGNYTNTILAGALQTTGGNNPAAATAQLAVAIANNPNLLLVKRITAINGQSEVNGLDLTEVIDDPGTTTDNHPNWPIDYLQGAINAGVVKPNDVLDYTIYFLSAGTVPITNITLCDLVPGNSLFLPDGFGVPDLGMALETGSSAVILTNVPDGDRGEYFQPGTTPTATCSAANTNGAIVVTIVQSPAALPNATSPGSPLDSYGFIRFRARVR